MPPGGLTRPTISITIPRQLLTDITAMSIEMGLTRSALISLVLTEWVRKKQNNFGTKPYKPSRR